MKELLFGFINQVKILLALHVKGDTTEQGFVVGCTNEKP